MPRTVITGFSGGGLADVGYRLAGYTPIGAVEFDPQIAEVYRANLGDHIRVESIMDTDWRTFDRPDLLHMSPECKEFSQAKSGGEEGPTQRAQADAICRALETLTPSAFVLENVVGYRRSDYSLPVILRTLERLGYCYDLANINSADFGVPQTRRRLILRAVRGGLVPHLPAPVRWVGWYAAIADIIDTLPESAFAPWQLARLPECLGRTMMVGQQYDAPNTTKDRRPQMRAAAEPSLVVTASLSSHGKMPLGFIVHPTDQRSMPVRGADEPVWTMTANSYGESHAPGPRPRAFIVPGGNASSFDVRGADEPARTVGDVNRAGNIPRAFIVDGKANSDGATVTVRGDGEAGFTVPAHASKHAARAWLDQGRVVAMTPRALGRFQSVPDGYQLPEARGLACKVIGNGVPCLLAQSIGSSLLGVL